MDFGCDSFAQLASRIRGQLVADSLERALAVYCVLPGAHRILEDNETWQHSFNTSVTLEELELDAEIDLTEEKLSIESIRLQFIENERDSLMSRISEVGLPFI